MNKKGKKYYHNEAVLKHYGNSVFNVGLWKSERFLIEKYFSKEKTLLDLGCGSGRTTFALYELGYSNILGADISDSMIEQCKNINLMKNLNLNFEIMDATKINYEDNYFDNIFFSFNGWSGIPQEKKRIKALQEIYRVLKKDGFFIFTAHELNEARYLQNKNLYLSECSEFQFEKEGDFIFKDYTGECDFLHLYKIEELKQIIEKNTEFKILEIINRDLDFMENIQIKEFADNTIFWVLKK